MSNASKMGLTVTPTAARIHSQPFIPRIAISPLDYTTEDRGTSQTCSTDSLLRFVFPCKHTWKPTHIHTGSWHPVVEGIRTGNDHLWDGPHKDKRNAISQRGDSHLRRNRRSALIGHCQIACSIRDGQIRGPSRSHSPSINSSAITTTPSRLAARTKKYKMKECLGR